VRTHEIGAKRCGSDHDPVQCFDCLRLSCVLGCCEGMTTKRKRFCCPPAEFPNGWTAKGLRQPGEQTGAFGDDSRRQHCSIEGTLQTADCLRG